MATTSGNNRYSRPVAGMDFLPVLLFGASWIGILCRGGRLAGVGMALLFAGGLCKALWKWKIACSGEESRRLNQWFRILMPAGGILSLAAAVRWGLAAPWNRIVTSPKGLLLAGFLLGMLLMGAWSRLLDDSPRSTWIKEGTNLAAQICLLGFVLLF